MQKAIAQFTRLNRDLDILLAEWELTAEEILQKKKPDEGWSNLQAGWHLIKSERQTLEYIRKKIQAGTGLSRAGLKAKLRHFVLVTSLKSPIKFRAPVSSIHPPDEANSKETIAEWRKTRLLWGDFLKEFPAELAGHEIFRHPLAGRINLYQTLDFLQQHFKHHLRQLRG